MKSTIRTQQHRALPEAGAMALAGGRVVDPLSWLPSQSDAFRRTQGRHVARWSLVRRQAARVRVRHVELLRV